MVAPTTSDEELLTVDQLAERTGVSVRTIRFYAGKGLLPAPHLRGRTGLYDARHRARLELIGELSALGLTLAAIERRLERIPHDAGPDELALQLALLAPWTPEGPAAPDGDAESVDAGELERRAGRPLSDAELRGLVALGALGPCDDGRFRLRDPAALTTGLETLASGLPPEFWRNAHEIIERHTTALAEDLMVLFQDQVLRPYRERGRRAEERTRLAAALSRLKPVTVQGVVAAFGRAVNRTIRERVGNED